MSKRVSNGKGRPSGNRARNHAKRVKQRMQAIENAARMIVLQASEVAMQQRRAAAAKLQEKSIAGRVRSFFRGLRGAA